MMLKVHLNSLVYKSDFEAFFKKTNEIHILKARHQRWLFFFSPFPYPLSPSTLPSLFCKRDTIQKSRLNGLFGKYCHLQVIKHFFSLNLQITDLVVTKSYNSFFFFFLPFQLVMSYLSVLGNDFSYLSSEFLLICRARVAEIMHVKWRCRKQLLSDVCCAVILLAEFLDKPFWICGL